MLITDNDPRKYIICKSIFNVKNEEIIDDKKIFRYNILDNINYGFCIKAEHFKELMVYFLFVYDDPDKAPNKNKNIDRVRNDIITLNKKYNFINMYYIYNNTKINIIDIEKYMATCILNGEKPYTIDKLY